MNDARDVMDKVLGIRLVRPRYREFTTAARNVRLPHMPVSSGLTAGELGRAVVEVYLTNPYVREIVEKHLKART